jgi:exonuclease SbcD
MAHAFVVSGSGHEGERSDSERDIRVGGVDSVPSTVFDGVDYVALGHLHGTQRVDGDRLRYSGSPLRYSFSEANQHKQALLVELAADGIPAVTSLPIRQPRPMATLTGTLDELLGSPELADATEAWAQVTVTDAARPTELLARVRARFPEALVVRHVPASGPLADRVSSVTPIPSRPSEVAEAFVRYVTGGDITPAELDAFESAYERVLADARSA